MKTTREKTAEIMAKLNAQEAWDHNFETALAADQRAHEANVAAIKAPAAAARAAAVAASHQADAEFLAFKRNLQR